MFSLFYGLWKYLFKKDEFYVLILGLDNAGKTTFLEQTKIKFNRGYKGVNLNKITTTVGLNIGKIEYKGIVMNFWDLGGQHELQSLWDKYYSESHGIIYIIDSADIERVDESKEAFDNMIANEHLAGIPLLIVANKQDIPEALSLDRIKTIFKSTDPKIGQRDVQSISVSALNSQGISESIDWITNCIKCNSESRPPHNADE
ncbi:ADP-ribosylation factor-related protein 1-like [Panonychus citri]|uniref:ADP-ribosylation factor-related protein 1-like n=1 Tax=Panonychus citri TaxID=50023 RepID=UPI00230801F2|nr:ADP-ribosylation factor-related protein 1-like [Panonychus citri]